LVWFWIRLTGRARSSCLRYARHVSHEQIGSRPGCGVDTELDYDSAT
jgi:hypothetical protein